MGELVIAFARLMQRAGRSALRLCSERGQTMAEYGILIAVIAIVVVVAAVMLGGSISSIFRSTGSHL